MHTITLPLTNVYAKGDYTATLYVGSEQQAVNLIIDTGSSTLVVEPNTYQPSSDQTLKASAVVQEVNYGIGGWAGALIHSEIHCLAHSKGQTSASTSLAIVEAEPDKLHGSTFGNADGILGMAYHHLNKSFDLSEYFSQHHIADDASYPWPFSIDKAHQQPTTPPKFADLKSFKSFLWKYPEQDVTPFFTQLASQHLVENCFSFYAKRSSVYVDSPEINAVNATTEQIEQLKLEPLNQGQLILGGGKEQTQLYQGEFSTIKVLHDVYYNVGLQSVQVGDNKPINAAPLAAKDEHAYFTNAIVDTGASLTVLTHEIYQQVVEQLTQINAEFGKLIAPFSDINKQYQGIDASQLTLGDWPDIHFIFTGENQESIKLTCPASHYWQLNTPQHDKACFKLLSQLPNWPNQTLIGLPLITNYYTVFDRTSGNTGAIHFAKQQ